MNVLSFTTATLTAGLMVGTAASAETVLLADPFGGAARNTISASTDGQTGDLSPIVWLERNFNGNAIVDGANRLRFEQDTGFSGGGDGAMVYLDNNFVGLTSFTVSMDILNNSTSGGDGRHIGLSVGQSKAELQAVTNVAAGNSVGDFFIGYDIIGANTGLQVFHNGSNQGFLGSPTLATPDTLSVEFTFADMNAGTTLNYTVYLDGALVGSGSTAWSGTDENYIAIQGNYTNFAYVDNFELTGELVPEPSSLALLGLGGLMIARRRRG